MEPIADESIEKPKTIEVFKNGVSNISKTADNCSYAYVNLNAEGKELLCLYEVLYNYPHLRYVNVSNNQINDLSTVVELEHLLLLNAAKNHIKDVSFLGIKGKLQYLQIANF